MKKEIRSIAINLPQFHPIPENDGWWGKGFTEWTNVTKAQPLFAGHYQPHLPADLGFYDLRLTESREAQVTLAKEYGVNGFCYYHYWFNGKRLLERPVDDILSSGKPDFPFMVCWANDNWTRRWDGLDQEILISHQYSPEDDVEHMKHLIQYFNDKRYITIDNKPVFILYKPHLLPNPTETAKRWRKVAREHGFDLYLCHMVFHYGKNWNRLVEGFDAAIDFEPFGIRRTSPLTRSSRISEVVKRSVYEKIKHKIVSKRPAIHKPWLNVYDYKSMYEELMPIKKTGLKLYPTIVPGWDNSARRADKPSLILAESTPEYFSKWLAKVLDDFEPYSKDENFIFLNAWNEWAEGNHLEPCQKWGTAYLEVLKKQLKLSSD